MEVLNLIDENNTNNTSYIKYYMISKDRNKLKNFYYISSNKLNINDKVYLVSKSTLLLFKYGKVIKINKDLINIQFNRYSLTLNKSEYYFFKQYNTYNILNDMIS